VTPDAEPIIEARGRRAPLARVASGFLFGLGFSIALVSIVVVAVAITMRVIRQEEQAKTWWKRFTADARLSVESFEHRRTRYNVILLGTVRNAGTDSWDSVRVEVRLLDSQRHVVGICRGYVNGPVRPAQQRYFSVDCDGTEREPVPEHSTYEVEVVDASYEREDGA
jgi:hypothetical protein